MPVHLKKAGKTPETESGNAREVVQKMLAEIEQRGEAAVREYAEKLDGWKGEIVVTAEEIERRTRDIPQRIRQDIEFATERVARFALAQRDVAARVRDRGGAGADGGAAAGAGQCGRVLCADRALCAHRVCLYEHRDGEGGGRADGGGGSTPYKGEGIHPQVLYAMKVAGADVVMTLGGVQAIAALAYGLFSGKPADIIVGPGNKYVAEAKRVLFGKVGIDVLAGPTEIGIIADDSADPAIVASDLVGQAEHGHESPAWLITLSEKLAKRRHAARAGADREAAADGEARRLARRGAITARWSVCETREEAAQVSDRYAPEHLEVHARDLDWWLARLTSYGSLVSGRGDDGGVRRQGVGSESHPADQGRGALFGRPFGSQVHEDAHLAAHDARGEPRARAGHGAHLAPRGHGGARAHRG